MGWIFLVGFLTLVSVLGYQRASLKVWALALVIFFALLTRFVGLGVFTSICWVVLTGVLLTLSVSSLRYRFISKPILKIYRKEMPSMSRTEREALNAGTISWEGELFKGNPQWDQLLGFAKPTLSAEEQAFLDGPVEELCAMIDDWDITHNLADLPPEMWQFLKEKGFFSLIIPKEYEGKGFSAYAHSQILTKVYGRSSTVATTIAVPNSLGPAELLLHYGTPEQKDYYLPRLARGEEVPCFALTGPEAGSDAGAMTDSGIVCWGEHEGKQVLGLRLNFNKRYITLAPVATVIGLAFKMYDPDHLLSEKNDWGITCALIPRNTAGVKIGRRHFPANIVFQNGPIHGKNVFIPIDWIIGGLEMAGHGWRMLMECLAAGRAISLPASGVGGAKVLSYASGAYARIRHQFNVPIGRFEGIEEVLARIAGNTYIMDATRSFTAAMIDQGAKPAVASAITKYHVTELSRLVSIDAMDVHGGKGICLGPKNYLVRFYEAVPVSITVEGANILTRCLIIFGQGAMRCHPYVFAEYEAAQLKNDKDALIAFDKALMGHMAYTVSNFFRTIILSLTGARIAAAPEGKLKRYFQQATRFSVAFALISDVSMLVFGGALKRKESISGRLGDILSYLYLLSATLKHYHDQGEQADDLPLVRWSSLMCLYQIQVRFDEILMNFPNRWVGYILRTLIFPFGQHFSKPKDKLNHKVAQLILSNTASRDRLAAGAFLTDSKGNMMSLLEDALIKSIAAEPVEKSLKMARQEKRIQGKTMDELANAAFSQQLISKEQLDIVLQAEAARSEVIAVDDFSSEDLARTHLKSSIQEIYAPAHSTD